MYITYRIFNMSCVFAVGMSVFTSVYTHCMFAIFLKNSQVCVPLSDEANFSVTDLAQLDLLLFFYICHETSARLCTSFYGELAVAVKTGAVVVFADVQQQVILAR